VRLGAHREDRGGGDECDPRAAYGGSRAPLDQLETLGLVPTDPATWRLGFTELERLVALAAE